MKKFLILIVIGLCLTGCSNKENLTNANIITTSYPVEYLVSELYGYNSNVSTIYPEGVNYNDYTLSNKKIRKYSNYDLFVYNGLSKEVDIAAKLVNKNKKLEIIDVSENLTITYSEQELWLNPSNYLMLAQNLKNSLEEHINSGTIKKEIDKNYETLKVNLSQFETDLKVLGENSTNKTIIVSKDYFKFLEKFGLKVVSLEENDSLTNDTINIAESLVTNKTNKYVFVTDEETATEQYSKTINKLIADGAEVKTLNTLLLLNKDNKEKNDDYVSLMKENIELIKMSVFN